jgi:hypothetical protein
LINFGTTSVASQASPFTGYTGGLLVLLIFMFNNLLNKRQLMGFFSIAVLLQINNKHCSGKEATINSALY